MRNSCAHKQVHARAYGIGGGVRVVGVVSSTPCDQIQMARELVSTAEDWVCATNAVGCIPRAVDLALRV